MSASIKTLCLAAAGAAVIAVAIAAGTAPAAACDIASASDIACGPGSRGGVQDGGALLSSLSDEAAQKGVTPPDGYEPENYPAAHHRHHHRHKRIE